MPIYYRENIDDDTFMGFWFIAESEDELKNLLFPHLDACQIRELANLKPSIRRKQWISTRLLIMELMGAYERIFYTEQGKPYIENAFNISLSHSHQLVAVIISKRRYVGIDVERMNDRIVDLAKKFLYPEDFDNMDKENLVEALYVNWCARESMYKIYGKGDVSIKNNMIIEPFKYKKDGDTIKGTIIKDGFRLMLDLKYFTIYNYMVTWCAQNPEDLSESY